MPLLRDGFDLGLRTMPFAVCALATPWLMPLVTSASGQHHGASAVLLGLLAGLASLAALVRGRVLVVLVKADALVVFKGLRRAARMPLDSVSCETGPAGLLLHSGDDTVLLDRAVPGAWLLAEYLRRRTLAPTDAATMLQAGFAKRSLGRRRPAGLCLHRPWSYRFWMRLGYLAMVAGCLAGFGALVPEVRALAAVCLACLALFPIRWWYDLTDTVLAVRDGLVCHGYTDDWVLYPFHALREEASEPQATFCTLAAMNRRVLIRRRSPTGARILALLRSHAAVREGAILAPEPDPNV